MCKNRVKNNKREKAKKSSSREYFDFSISCYSIFNQTRQHGVLGLPGLPALSNADLEPETGLGPAKRETVEEGIYAIQAPMTQM